MSSTGNGAMTLSVEDFMERERGKGSLIVPFMHANHDFSTARKRETMSFILLLHDSRF